MVHYNCSSPSSPLIGSARILYVASCFATITVSIALQTIFALTCQKIKGWKSDFAFYLLQLMAIFGFLSYIGSLVFYIHGLIRFDSPGLSRVCIASIVLFYFVFIAITLSPLASMEFCPAHFFFRYDRTTSLMNRLFNYMIGVVNVTAYTIMFATLFIKGSLTFRRNSEIRMTAQAALVSVCELAFFLFWEYGPSTALFWRRTLDTYTTLAYYDVLLLPYIIFNKTVKTEMKNLFG
ncbi:hypothetical protein V3C99_013972, partial [Haemonchus contortus]